MLNWRRDPDYERRMNAKLIEIEQLRHETKRLKELNSKLDALLRSPDSSCSTPPETDCS
jgi:hypothetical protein